MSISVFSGNNTADERSTGRRLRVSHPVLLCCSLLAISGLTLLCGCSKAPDILSQEPVIPLTSEPIAKEDDVADTDETDGEFPELHLSGNSTSSDRAPDSGRSVSEDTAEDRTDMKTATEEDQDVKETGAENEAGSKEDLTEKDSKTDSEDDGYQVEGVQLSEDQLEKLSAYFNLEDVNPHLQQVYLIPEDFDPDAENVPVNITCVAGSYDTNRLYSIFYKKEGSNALWNVIMRRNGDTYRFHTNQLLDPNRDKQKTDTEKKQ